MGATTGTRRLIPADLRSSRYGGTDETNRTEIVPWTVIEDIHRSGLRGPTYDDRRDPRHSNKPWGYAFGSWDDDEIDYRDGLDGADRSFELRRRRIHDYDYESPEAHARDYMMSQYNHLRKDNRDIVGRRYRRRYEEDDYDDEDDDYYGDRRRARHHRDHRRADKDDAGSKAGKTDDGPDEAEAEADEDKQPPRFWAKYVDYNKTGLASAAAGAVIGGLIADRFGGYPNKRVKRVGGALLGALAFNVAQHQVRRVASEKKEELKGEVDKMDVKEARRFERVENVARQ